MLLRDEVIGIGKGLYSDVDCVHKTGSSAEAFIILSMRRSSDISRY